MGGNAGGQGPRQLFQQGSAAATAGVGQNPTGMASQSGGMPGVGNYLGMRNMAAMVPGIMQSMQTGSMNPMISSMIQRALSGGFGTPEGRPTGPMPVAPSAKFPNGLPAASGPGSSSGIGLPGESRNMSGAPMQFGPARPNPGMGMPQPLPGGFGGGFASPGVPFINRPPPIVQQPSVIPPGMQNPQPLFPTNPGSGAPQPGPAVPSVPSVPRANPVAGNQNAGRIAYLQQLIGNPDQSAPIALLRARTELRRLTGG